MGIEEIDFTQRLQRAEKRARRLRSLTYSAEGDVKNLKDELEFGVAGPTCDLQDVFYELKGSMKAGIRKKWGKTCLVFYKPREGDYGGYCPNVVLPYSQAVALARFILDNPPTEQPSANNAPGSRTAP